MVVRSAKICRSGLKLEMIMNSSGRPNTRQSRIRAMTPSDRRTVCFFSPGLVDGNLSSRVGHMGGDVAVGSRICNGGHQRTSLSRVR